MAEQWFKIRFRFRKEGDLRFVSHHDLMRLFERMLRRAALPVRHSSGFHPKPRLVFAHALGLGIAATNEVVEIEFTQPLSPEAVMAQLNATAPPGLVFHQAREIPTKLTGQPLRLDYQGWWPSSSPPPNLPQQLADLWNQPEWWIERVKGAPPSSRQADGEERLDQFDGLLIARPRPTTAGPRKRLNIKPLVETFSLVDNHLRLSTICSSGGGARPDEVLRLAGLWNQFVDGQLLLERTSVVLIDEVFPILAKPAAGSLPESDVAAASPVCKGST